MFYMVRPRLPDDKVTPDRQRIREYYRKNPDAHEKNLEYQRQYYKKYKVKHQFRKKSYANKLRDSYINILGGKCASCGETFNPYAKRSNLEFDHLVYLQSKTYGNSPPFQIKRLIEQVDPNKKFLLLCNTCHMALTALRKNKEKSKHVVELANKLVILEPSNTR